MKEQNDLIKYRLERSDESFGAAKPAVEHAYWNTAGSHLYYTCFYILLALFAKHDIKTTTHSGVKTIFSLNYIKENLVNTKWGRLFNRLHDGRQRELIIQILLTWQKKIFCFYILKLRNL